MQNYNYTSFISEKPDLTLQEEHGLRVFGNMVLRIFGPKRDEETEGW
jgi:hypothetical protein